MNKATYWSCVYKSCFVQLLFCCTSFQTSCELFLWHPPDFILKSEQWQTGAFYSFTSFSFWVSLSFSPAMHVGLLAPKSRAVILLAGMNQHISIFSFVMIESHGWWVGESPGGKTARMWIWRGPPPPQLASSSPSCCFSSQLGSKIRKMLKFAERLLSDLSVPPAFMESWG